MPWFDPHCPVASYHESKTAKYFKLVKFIMESALHDLTYSSFNKFYAYLCSFIPKSVEIKSINEVINYYEDGTIVSSLTST